jgi:hypothetical protein
MGIREIQFKTFLRSCSSGLSSTYSIFSPTQLIGRPIPQTYRKNTHQDLGQLKMLTGYEAFVNVERDSYTLPTMKSLKVNK